jgi:hypothetical protein
MTGAPKPERLPVATPFDAAHDAPNFPGEFSIFRAALIF